MDQGLFRVTPFSFSFSIMSAHSFGNPADLVSAQEKQTQSAF